MFAVWERLHDGDQGPQARARGEMAWLCQYRIWALRA